MLAAQGVLLLRLPKKLLSNRLTAGAVDIDVPEELTRGAGHHEGKRRTDIDALLLRGLRHERFEPRIACYGFRDRDVVPFPHLRPNEEDCAVVERAVDHVAIAAHPADVRL